MGTGYRIFSILFLAVGIWALFDGTQRAVEAIRARSWPVARGTVLISRYDQWRTKGDIRVAALCIELEYIYLVGDKVYEGHRVNTGWKCFGDQKHMEEILKRYPSGKTVEVRYDPDNPKISLLEPRVDWTSFFLWGLGIISISVGLPLFRHSIKGVRNK